MYENYIFEFDDPQIMHYFHLKMFEKSNDI